MLTIFYHHLNKNMKKNFKQRKRRKEIEIRKMEKKARRLKEEAAQQANGQGGLRKCREKRMKRWV
jgi:hypothetical protein